MIEVEVALRPKNQITLPEQVVRRLGAEPGDRLIIAVQDDLPSIAHIRRLPLSYAGSMAGVYGTPEDISTFVRGERESWTK